MQVEIVEEQMHIPVRCGNRRRFAFPLACVDSSVRVAAVFCGQLPRPRSALRQSCPIIASYAGRDLTCTGIAARLDRTLEHYDVPHDVKVYASAAHAFYDPYGPMYHQTAAREAWERSLNFIRAQFRGG